MTVVTFFFSRRHMEDSTEEDLADLLEGENLVRWILGPRRVSARPFRDKAGSDMWSASVVVGIEDDRFTDDNLRLKPYPRTIG